MQNKIKRGFFVLLLALYGFTTVMAGNITFSVKDMPIRSVLVEIEKISEYHFFYNSTGLQGLDMSVTLSVTDSDIKDVMGKLLQKTEIGYSLEQNNVIVLFKKTEEQIPNGKDAQKKVSQISGQVVDAKTNEPIIGASIRKSGTAQGTITDFDGNFTLPDISPNSVLEISYVGYDKIEVTVTDKTVYNVKLSETLTSLDEVVVVGYGSQKKVNLTGAVSVVKSSDITGRPSVNTATALQGADPALNITMSAGGPAAGYDIDIRGVASINTTQGTQPLVLVDGVEMSLSRVNANDIETVSILKDASAAAMYGAKAAAGVVLITTKSGKDGSKPIVTFDAKAGWKSTTTPNDYNTSGYWDAYINDMFMQGHANYSYTSYKEADYAELWMRNGQTTETAERPWAVVQNDGSYKYYANYDWYDHYFKQMRPVQDYNVSVKGGGDKINYYVSGRYYDEDGMIAQNTDKWKSVSTRAKLNIKIRPWLRYGVNFSYFNSKYTYPGCNSTADLFRSVFGHAMAYVPSTNPDGSSVYLNGYTYSGTATVGGGYNAMLNYGKHYNIEQNRETVIKNQLDIDFYKNLTLTLDYSYDWRYKDYEGRRVKTPYSQFLGQTSYLDVTGGRDQYSQNFHRYQTHNYNAYLTWSPALGQNNMKLTVGYNGEMYKYRYMKVERYDLLTDELSNFNFATGEVATLLEGVSNAVTNGFFGRFNYDYAGRYLLEVSARADGTSRFAKGHRWGVFPSASAGWRISEEKFWEPVSGWWNNFKLRASAGSLGNQLTGYYDYIETIATSSKLSGITLDGTSQLAYATESDPAAGNLTWEKVTTYDVGVDWGFFNNRLNFTADGYIRNTTGMLVEGMSLPAVYGASVPKMNSGDMRTTGWELSLSWNDKFTAAGKPFKYSASVGIGDYKTVITKYNNPTKIIDTEVYDTDYIYYEGMTLGEIWGYTVDGLFATDAEAANYAVDQSLINQDIVLYGGARAGDMRFVDLDGDNVITAGDNTANNSGDLRVIGNTLPRYSYNFRLGAEWYGVDFSMFFQGIGKRDWYPNTEARAFWGPYTRPYQGAMSSNFLNMVWSEDNPNGYFPRARAYEANATFNELGTPCSRYLQSIAYLRMKNLTVGYTIPLWKNIFSQIRVYFAGENLFYWSPLKKYCESIDPEQAAALSTGAVYSFSKSFTFGLNVEF